MYLVLLYVAVRYLFLGLQVFNIRQLGYMIFFVTMKVICLYNLWHGVQSEVQNIHSVSKAH